MHSADFLLGYQPQVQCPGRANHGRNHELGHFYVRTNWQSIQLKVDFGIV